MLIISLSKANVVDDLLKNFFEGPVQLSVRLERYLKSFLRAQSYTVTEVRGFGHDFRKLAKLALKSGFEFSATDIEVIMALGDSDAVIEARYIRIGAKIGSLSIETIRGTCKRLHEAIGKQLSEKGVLVRR